MSDDSIMAKIKARLKDMSSGFHMQSINYDCLLEEIEAYGSTKYLEGYNQAHKMISADPWPHKKHRAKIKELEEKVRGLEGMNKNLKDALQAIVQDDLRRLSQESGPFNARLSNFLSINLPDINNDFYTRDAYLIRALTENGYAVADCPNAVRAIKGYLDQAFLHGKDVAGREYQSQIEFLQGKVKHKDSVIEQLQESLRNMRQRNKATQDELNSLEGMHLRSDEHMVKTIRRLEGELKAAKSDAEWHDAGKLLPYGNRRLQMQAKGVGQFGGDVYFTGYGKALHRENGRMKWRFEQSIPPGVTHSIVSWRYADE